MFILTEIWIPSSSIFSCRSAWEQKFVSRLSSSKLYSKYYHAMRLFFCNLIFAITVWNFCRNHLNLMSIIITKFEKCCESTSHSGVFLSRFIFLIDTQIMFFNFSSTVECILSLFRINNIVLTHTKVCTLTSAGTAMKPNNCGSPRAAKIQQTIN